MSTNQESEQTGQHESTPTSGLSRRWSVPGHDDTAGRSGQEAAVEQGLVRQNVRVLRPDEAVPSGRRLRQHGPLLLVIVAGALLILLVTLGVALG